MRTMPTHCRDINAVGAFCDCIADEDTVDEAINVFCQRVAAREDPSITGDTLAELKRALMDLED